jgi:hypothetical protein
MSLTKFSENKIVNVIAYVAMLLGTFGFILFLIKKVKFGSGLDHYMSMMGYKLSYLQALMIFGSVPLVLILALVISHFLNKDERDFIQKYKIKDEE